MSEDYSEFEIRRKGWPKRISKEVEVRDGFVISGPEIVDGEIRLCRREEKGGVVADTPWGMMTIQGQGQGTTGRFTVSASWMPSVNIDLKVGSYLDLYLSGEKLRFKNRTVLVHRYRFDGRLGQIEVRAETKGLFKGGPFPNEWKKIWKIALKGQFSVDKTIVLPPLAVFLCYFKTVWPDYDTMF